MINVKITGYNTDSTIINPDSISTDDINQVKLDFTNFYSATKKEIDFTISSPDFTTQILTTVNGTYTLIDSLNWIPSFYSIKFSDADSYTHYTNLKILNGGLGKAGGGTKTVKQTQKIVNFQTPLFDEVSRYVFQETHNANSDISYTDTKNIPATYNSFEDGTGNPDNDKDTYVYSTDDLNMNMDDGIKEMKSNPIVIDFFQDFGNYSIMNGQGTDTQNFLPSPDNDKFTLYASMSRGGLKVDFTKLISNMKKWEDTDTSDKKGANQYQTAHELSFDNLMNYELNTNTILSKKLNVENGLAQKYQLIIDYSSLLTKNGTDTYVPSSNGDKKIDGMAYFLRIGTLWDEFKYGKPYINASSSQTDTSGNKIIDNDVVLKSAKIFNKMWLKVDADFEIINAGAPIIFTAPVYLHILLHPNQKIFYYQNGITGVNLFINPNDSENLKDIETQSNVLIQFQNNLTQFSIPNNLMIPGFDNTKNPDFGSGYVVPTSFVNNSGLQFLR